MGGVHSTVLCAPLLRVGVHGEERPFCAHPPCCILAEAEHMLLNGSTRANSSPKLHERSKLVQKHRGSHV